MFHLTVAMYQLFGILFMLAMPTAMMLGILWMFIKMGKTFARSIKK